MWLMILTSLSTMSAKSTNKLAVLAKIVLQYLYRCLPSSFLAGTWLELTKTVGKHVCYTKYLWHGATLIKMVKQEYYCL